MQVDGRVVKIWSEWPDATSRAIIVWCKRAREASISGYEHHITVVELLCGARAAIHDAQRGLEQVVGDSAATLEWMSLALKRLGDLPADVVNMSVPGGGRGSGVCGHEVGCCSGYTWNN